MNRQRYIIEVQPMPDCPWPAGALKLLLKRLLRDGKLRCVGIREADAPKPVNATDELFTTGER